MKRNARSLVVLAAAAFVLALVGGVRLYAHHAFGAEFDPNLPVLLKGPVVRIEARYSEDW